MEEADPALLLEWLGVAGDMQIVALEQLCMMLLLSDNVDKIFERFNMAFDAPLSFFFPPHIIFSHQALVECVDTRRAISCLCSVTSLWTTQRLSMSSRLRCVP